MVRIFAGSVGRCSVRWLAPTIALAIALLQAAHGAEPLRVGSKRFTESYVLGEIVRQTLVAHGIDAVHKQGLGNTGILEQALASGSIDLYPEYTGTIVRELLKREGNPSLAELNTWLAPRGLKAAVPFGFNNTYALAMLESRAQALGITKISDLLRPAAAGLALGLSHEFLERADGWPALKAAYRLPQTAASGLDHGLAYEAIATGRVDLIDVYSTDAKIGRYHLRVLKDDLEFFPKYEAVLLMRASVDPTPLKGLEGRIDAQTMIALNAQVELDGMSFAGVARGFVAGRSARTGPGARQTFWERLFAPDFGRLLGQHLML
ncbi:MAG: glycine betaine ABC transporter substrate-binding protein, partial [Caldimonas sp.]